MTDFENPKGRLPSQPDAPNLKFERADWTSFRTVEGLQQKAGVPAGKLRRLVLKELADNALDTGASVRIGELPKGGYFVEDDGPGIDGEPEEIARLFSIDRPMVSTKLLRLPTRGALGNGLRVVAGSVLASDGFLAVTTRNRRIELRPQRDGSTTVVKVTPVKFPVGTRIEIGFGPAIPEDEDALYWAKVAVRMAHGQAYAGKSSPYWYDVPQFHELLSASGTAPVRELVANLDGCTGGRAGEIVAEAGLGRMACRDVSRKQAEHLLAVARSNAQAGHVEAAWCHRPRTVPGLRLACRAATASFGTEPFAEIPYRGRGVGRGAARTCGSWPASTARRSPAVSDAARDKREINLFGCGLRHTVAEAPKDKNFVIWLNITTPYMPITSDGKDTVTAS